MKIDIKVPAMGESITQATIGTLLKPSNSYVEADEEILELETDKVNQVLYAPQAGTLTLQVNPGVVVKIGEVIGYIDTEKDAAPGKPANIAKAEKPSTEKPSAKEQPFAKAEKGVRQSVTAALSELKTESSAETPQSPAPPLPKGLAKPKQSTSSLEKKEGRETRRRMSMIRRVIAERLVEAQNSSAMLTTFNEVDMSQIMALREKYKDSFQREHAVKLGLMSFFVKAAVSALQLFPDMNSYIDGEEIVHREYIDIGIAVGAEKGLFVPVLRNCNELSFAGIEQAIEEYAKKAREGSLTVDDMRGGGFTITNGGVYGSLLSTPIINPPQAGILGMHKIEKRPVVINDQIVIRPMMYLALSYDHRLIDGKEAVAFLIQIKNALEDPTRLLLEI